MKFKYNFLAISLLGAMAVSCDPMEDIYDEIDAEETVITKSEDEYVLTKADYEAISKAAGKDAQNDDEKYLASSVAKKQALNNFASAEKYVPTLLAKMYATWGKGSTVGVTYNYYDKQEGVVKYLQNIDNAYLKDADYDAVWAEDGIKGVHFLSPKHAPAEALPGVLANKYPEAKKFDKVLVDYKYDTVDPEVIPGEDLINELFESAEKYKTVVIEGWKQSILEGKETWEGRDFSNNHFANISAYQAKSAVKVALITPTINIASFGGKFTFDMAYGHYKGDCLKVFVSDKFKSADSTFVAAEWQDITSSFKFANPDDAVKGYTPWVNCGEYNLDAFVGKDVTFAFYYEGEDKAGGVTTTVQLDNVKVSTIQISESHEQKNSALYQFNGEAWEEYTHNEVAVVTPADYDAMGAPGSHDNFSKNDKPEAYIPAFLAHKYPYAKDGDVKAVVYKFYNGKGTNVDADEYKRENGAWVKNSYISTRVKETFLHNGKEWLFDPTVVCMVEKADYDYLVGWVKENKPAYMDAKYDNTEYWFGGSSHYANFNVQLIKRRSNDPENLIPAKDEEAKKYLDGKIAEGVAMVLAHNNPNAPTQMSGLDLYFKISCKVYDGSSNFRYTFKFKSLGNGKFEQEGEPTVEAW